MIFCEIRIFGEARGGRGGGGERRGGGEGGGGEGGRGEGGGAAGWGGRENRSVTSQSGWHHVGIAIAKRDHTNKNNTNNVNNNSNNNNELVRYSEALP